MRLRQIINGTLLALGILGVATAILLVFLTSYLNRTVQVVHLAMTEVRFVERIELDLRRFNYRSNVFYLTGDPEYQVLRSESEARLRDNLAFLQDYTEDEAAQALLRDVETAVLEAITTRLALEAEQLPLDRLIAESTPSLTQALRATGLLIQDQLGEVDAVTLDAARLDRWANVWALAAAALLLLGIAIVLAIVHQRVYLPLSRLQQAIHTFGTGNEAARAQPSGPPELREIGDTFNQVADRLREQRDNRVTFLAAVAHDLRNPLTAIRGYAEVIGRREELPPAQETRRMVGLIGHEAKLLTRMLDDFLDTARIEAGTLELQIADVDARVLAQPSVELFQASTDKHELNLSVPEEPLIVACDAYRIEQVVNNLISNAIKYSPRGGPINVRVARDGAQARFAVTDEGLGIAAEDIPPLFQPFRRVGTASADIPGAGLGLSVVRRIVEAHGGAVGVESTVDVGSTFWFTLPLRA